MVKRVYQFGNGTADATIAMKDIVGGKGAGLAEMAGLGIPVPPGFTIATTECIKYNEIGKKLSDELKADVKVALARVEELTGKKFGDNSNPLLFSVRSGARASMPGMMDTVLNLGLNFDAVKGLATSTKNERFAWDSFRRFISMYSNVVMGMEGRVLGKTLDDFKEKKGYKFDTDMTVDDLKELVNLYLPLVKTHAGEFPMDPFTQLWGAIGAVFDSWENERAKVYRRLNKIPDEWGTAVTVQSMVFGNKGDTSATGVCFSRDPNTGNNQFYGDWLPNAQGEDVVAGIRTPQPINKNNVDPAHPLMTLEEYMPEAYAQLVKVYKTLESHFKNMQDMEFTVEDNKLYLLQCRTGKCTAFAAVKMAVDMVNEGLIDKEEAVMRVEPQQLDQLLHPIFDPKAKRVLIAKGIAASPGAATGRIVFTAHEAKEWASRKEKVVLVRLETTPEDIEGMNVSQGILTCRGGKTSHAAVVARGMGRCCVCGCEEIILDEHAKTMTTKEGKVLKEGDFISLEGSEGKVYEGKIDTMKPGLSGDFAQIMIWADEVRRLKIRTNADTPKDAKTARDFGAQGIGLTRTEHMFFEGERIKHMREMILSANLEQREKALSKLLKYQREDFYGILKAMEGLPVNIRTLDPPLHEFLPTEEHQIVEISKEMNVPAETLRQKIKDLHESNPMLGHRGCRLGVVMPEITRMQARAIFEAAAQLTKEGIDVHPEVMIPLVSTTRELEIERANVENTAAAVIKETGVHFHYKVGTMIEIPRAAILADQIAKYAEFFSFGTNDLTQMTFGYSRDDAGKFLPYYVENKILPADPFVTVDQAGVGFLLERAVTLGRKTRPDITVGICGEHGGEPESVKFCHKIGLDYVSCSPFRVPIARLAAAHAAIIEKRAANKSN